MATSDIISNFVNQIDTDQEYSLNDLKKVLTEAYKAEMAKVKPVKKSKLLKAYQQQPKAVLESDSDDDKPKKRGRPIKVKLDKNGNPKVKKAPSVYNIYVKQAIEALKKESPETPARELMTMVAQKWKAMSDDDKAEFRASL
jgi:hypothetical protein